MGRPTWRSARARARLPVNSCADSETGATRHAANAPWIHSGGERGPARSARGRRPHLGRGGSAGCCRRRSTSVSPNFAASSRYLAQYGASRRGSRHRWPPSAAVPPTTMIPAPLPSESRAQGWPADGGDGRPWPPGGVHRQVGPVGVEPHQLRNRRLIGRRWSTTRKVGREPGRNLLCQFDAGPTVAPPITTLNPSVDEVLTTTQPRRASV